MVLGTTLSGSGKIRQHLFIPKGVKIADIQEADTNGHTLNLATALSETRRLVAIILRCRRISGTGAFYIHPNETAEGDNCSDTGQIITLATGLNRVLYNQSVANDDFDLYCYGYVVEV